MVLVGTLVVAVAALAGEWRAREARDAAALRRIAFGTLLAGALPSYVLMRVGAEWIGSEENVDEIDAAWGRHRLRDREPRPGRADRRDRGRLDRSEARCRGRSAQPR